MKTTVEKIEVMQAYEDGKTIIVSWAIGRKEERIKKNYGEQEWNWNACDYAIKEEPKQVPFERALCINKYYKIRDFGRSNKGRYYFRLRSVYWKLLVK